MVKIISVISNHAGSGQTTVTINLAGGLLRKGYRVLIGDLDQNHKLFNWLGVRHKDRVIDLNDINTRAEILSSRMGIDLLMVRTDALPQSPICLPDLKKLHYDYLLLQPVSNENCRLTSTIADVVIACTDLSHANELKELQALERCLQASTGKVNNIDIILPNKINTKEWNHNSKLLFDLADYFGFEKIADPIPC